jgi:hypothetical protein
MTEFNKQIKTRAWVHYVASVVSLDDQGSMDSDFYGWIYRKTETSKVHMLERNTGILAQNWSRYRSGERDVGLSTLKRAEQRIPGSLNVYNVGPDGAPLWLAMWSDDESTLWEISKLSSSHIQYYQAYNTNNEYMIDFTRAENAEIYYSALLDYYEDRVRTAICMFNIEDVTALIAAFRLARLRKDVNNYREALDRYLKFSLKRNTYAFITLRNYGIADYVIDYVDQMNPSSVKISLETPVIRRKSAISECLEEYY